MVKSAIFKPSPLPLYLYDTSVPIKLFLYFFKSFIYPGVIHSGKPIFSVIQHLSNILLVVLTIYTYNIGGGGGWGRYHVIICQVNT